MTQHTSTFTRQDTHTYTCAERRIFALTHTHTTHAHAYKWKIHICHTETLHSKMSCYSCGAQNAVCSWRCFCMLSSYPAAKLQIAGDTTIASPFTIFLQQQHWQHATDGIATRTAKLLAKNSCCHSY